MDCKLVAHLPAEIKRMVSGMGRRGDSVFWEQRANSIKTSGISKENQRRKNKLPAHLLIRCTFFFFFNIWNLESNFSKTQNTTYCVINLLSRV